MAADAGFSFYLETMKGAVAYKTLAPYSSLSKSPAKTSTAIPRHSVDINQSVFLYAAFAFT